MIIPDKNRYLKENPDFSATLIEPIKLDKNVTLVKVNLWTGKKHQIRAHLTTAGHPLLGDAKYNSQQSQSFSLLNQIDRYYLHCQSITLEDNHTYQAPIPQSFQNKVEELLRIKIG